MAVYVDRGGYRFGRMIMCHLIADTPAELAAMVDRIGVARKWFQSEASVPHFDIAQSKRALAVQHGAIEAERNQFVEVVRALRSTWPRAEGKWLL